MPDTRETPPSSCGILLTLDNYRFWKSPFQMYSFERTFRLNGLGKQTLLLVPVSGLIVHV